jgi:hypothetical protein
MAMREIIQNWIDGATEVFNENASVWAHCEGYPDPAIDFFEQRYQVSEGKQRSTALLPAPELKRFSAEGLDLMDSKAAQARIEQSFTRPDPKQGLRVFAIVRLGRKHGDAKEAKSDGAASSQQQEAGSKNTMCLGYLDWVLLPHRCLCCTVLTLVCLSGSWPRGSEGQKGGPARVQGSVHCLQRGRVAP